MSTSSGRTRPSLNRLRAGGGRRRKPLPVWPCQWKGCCCEIDEKSVVEPAVLTRQVMTRQEKDSPLSMYGIDELSDVRVRRLAPPSPHRARVRAHAPVRSRALTARRRAHAGLGRPERACGEPAVAGAAVGHARPANRADAGAGRRDADQNRDSWRAGVEADRLRGHASQPAQPTHALAQRVRVQTARARTKRARRGARRRS